MDDQRDYAEEQANRAAVEAENRAERLEELMSSVTFTRESNRTNLHSIKVNGCIWGMALETASVIEIHALEQSSMWMVAEVRTWEEARFVISQYALGVE